MIVEQLLYTCSHEKKRLKIGNISDKAQMLLVFGAQNLIRNKKIFEELRSFYPQAYILGCSTAGEIFESQVSDNTLTATAVYFEKTSVKFASTEILDNQDCYDVSVALSGKIPHSGLKHIFVLSEGLCVNGSQLVAGFRDSLPEDVTITGGLSGDGSNFRETYVIANDYPRKKTVVLAAFYGDNINIGFGSVGGWDSFGIDRTVTCSLNNILYELDGKPALDLYKEYLGEHSKDLPMSGFYFPLSIRSKDNKYKFVRTILKIDEENKSLIFAGDIPEGYYAKLMKTNINNVINGAMKAAEISSQAFKYQKPKLAVLISCVGRRLVLKQMVDDEIAITREVLGEDTVYSGFYSYGEISHADPSAPCELHNQTMTITIFDEI